MIVWLPVLLALAFPLLAHAAAASESDTLAAVAVSCLAFAIAWPLRVRPLAWIALLVAVAVLIVVLWWHGRAMLLMLLPPVLITAAVGVHFARSLGAGRVPLIERIVRQMDPQALEIDGVLAYTRRTTWMWAVLLLGLSAINLTLALLAVPGGLLHAAGITSPRGVRLEHWSLFANVLNYVILALVFVLEFVYRVRRFPQHPDRTFRSFIMRMARMGPDAWRRP